MLTSNQRGLLVAFGASVVEGRSVEEHLDDLVELKGWDRDSTTFRSVHRALLDAGRELQGEDDADGVSLDEPIIVTPESSDDGIKLDYPEHELTEDKRGTPVVDISEILKKLALKQGQLEENSKSTCGPLSLEEALARVSLHASDTGTASIPAASRRVAGCRARQHEATTQTVAGSKARYFDRFPNFQPDNAAPIQQEFHRLATTMAWKPASEEFRSEQRIAYASELQYLIHARYEAAGTLERVQAFCVDLGITAELPSLTQCKKALKSVHVNIFDYIDCCRKESVTITPVFTTKSSFRKYTKRSKVFPKLAVKGDPSLGFLLEKLFAQHHHPR